MKCTRFFELICPSPKMRSVSLCKDLPTPLARKYYHNNWVFPMIFLEKLFPNFLDFLGIKKLGFGANFLGKLGTVFGENSWGIPRKPG